MKSFYSACLETLLKLPGEFSGKRNKAKKLSRMKDFSLNPGDSLKLSVTCMVMLVFKVLKCLIPELQTSVRSAGAVVLVIIEGGQGVHGSLSLKMLNNQLILTDGTFSCCCFFKINSVMCC